MQNSLLVSGENPVVTKTDKLLVSSSRVDLSSPTTIGLSTEGEEQAAGFGLPNQFAGSSVGVSLVKFTDNPYAFAGEDENEGVASQVIALDLQVCRRL
jgi:hypothetical protein